MSSSTRRASTTRCGGSRWENGGRAPQRRPLRRRGWSPPEGGRVTDRTRDPRSGRALPTLAGGSMRTAVSRTIPAVLLLDLAALPAAAATHGGPPPYAFEALLEGQPPLGSASPDRFGT